ncbi:MAG: signal peptidase I [Clostridiales bacterium]|nr:signal peptidase I [Clostridiales bacterium]
MANSAEQNEATPTVAAQPKKKSKIGKVFKVAGVLLLLFVLVALTLNALLSMFSDNYYTTFGKYRLFAIVTDSMEPEIPTGSMIVDVKPTSEAEITVGTVITFRAKSGKDTILLTHRVTAIGERNGQTVYTTKGDNAGGTDAYKPTFDDIAGVYTGNKCGFFGSLFGFFQSSLGISMLIFCLFIVIVAWVAIWYINRTEIRKKVENAALKKSAQALSSVSLRYDNITEITAVMDVLGMLTDTPQTHAEAKAISDRLMQFIRAENLELPKTPETAAVLDSLPAPDTPSSLAVAMSQGATLRQAEDGQTLVLTTATGGKNILLTPVQTADGVILCQQGVRLRSDLAPDIERLGLMSMPTNPEFFEGQPLEKNVIYPELPQPTARLGPDELLSAQPPNIGNLFGEQQLSSPVPVTNLIDGGNTNTEKQALPSGAHTDITADAEKPSGAEKQEKQEKAKKQEKPESSTATNAGTSAAVSGGSYLDAARLKYAAHRKNAAELEIKQAETLHELLTDAEPLTEEEQAKLKEYKAAQAKAKASKPKTQRKPKTPEQKAKAKAAAESKKAAQEAFLSSLSPEDRELYLAEVKLAKARESSIRKLKRLAADRKLLEQIEEE